MHSEFLCHDPCTRSAGYSYSKASSTMCTEQSSLVVSAVIQTKNRGEIIDLITDDNFYVCTTLLSKHTDSVKILRG